MVRLVLLINGQPTGNSIWLTDMVISYTAARKITSILLFLTFVRNTLITFCSLTLIFINRNPLIIHQSKTFDWNLESCILNYGWQVLFCPQGIPKGYLLFLFLVLLLLFLLLLLLSVLLFQK